MFKVRTGSVEDYFRFDPEREDALRELDTVIRAAAPALSRKFVPGTLPGQPGMTMTMVGYGQYRYTVKSAPAPITWPIIGIALQKNYLSFYNNAYGDGLPFTCAYSGKLGRARVSTKGVVTFTNIDDINLQALAEMVTASPRPGIRPARSALSANPDYPARRKGPQPGQRAGAPAGPHAAMRVYRRVHRPGVRARRFLRGMLNKNRLPSADSPAGTEARGEPFAGERAPAPSAAVFATVVLHSWSCIGHLAATASVLRAKTAVTAPYTLIRTATEAAALASYIADPLVAARC